SLLDGARPRFLQIAQDYGFLNPHLTLRLSWHGQEAVNFPALAPAWKKWLPSNPTSAHWYEPERFPRLGAAYLAHDADPGRDRTVREFVAEFEGLAGTAKQTRVLEETGLKRAPLSALVRNDEVNAEAAGRLLAAMREHSKPVQPKRLGALGKDTLRQR